MRSSSYIHEALGYINTTRDDTVLNQLTFSDTPHHEVSDDTFVDEFIRPLLENQLFTENLGYKQSGTSFQQTVWSYLSTIPYGTTQTYKQVAESMGIPNAIRAIATAIAANKIALLVPCHRVIGSDGSLHGFAWGLHRKQYLLEHERMTVTNGMVR